MNTETITEEMRINALVEFLGEDKENIVATRYDECQFETPNGEYLVLTDDEADEKVKDYIRESIWAFNASFLASYTDLPEEMFKGMQDKCEGANDAFLKCVERAPGGFDGFVEEAINADGRGHFLNTYDNEENEQGQFFIYRVN